MRNSSRRVRKVVMSLSSLRSPRSPMALAAVKRFSTSASETLRRMTALISWPAAAAADMTESSSPNQRPIEERISGNCFRSARLK